MARYSLVKTLLGSALALLLATTSPIAVPEAQAQVKVILDTDMDLDVDDAGALAVLHALADKGEAEILGVICDAPTQRNGNTRLGAATISAINAYYGRPGIPIGDLPVAEYANSNYSRYQNYERSFADPDDVDHTKYTYYNEYIKANFPNSNIASVYDGVTLYRKLLAGAPDNSVVIVGVGLLRVLNDLMYSAGDGYSSLNGKQLIAKKVKRLVAMTGCDTWTDTWDYSSDFNWSFEGLGDAVRITGEWPTPIVVMPLGGSIQTGQRLSTETPTSNPVRKSYELFLSHKATDNRSSWDQLAVIAGVRETDPDNIFRELIGKNLVSSWKSASAPADRPLGNRWLTPTSTDKPDILLRQDASMTNDELKVLVEDLMVQAPTRKYAGELEAESAFFSGVTYSKVNDGYTGTGYANYNNINTDYVEWTLKSFETGPVNLKFRYANGFSDNRPLKLSVNGTVISSSLTFNPTGSWTTWKTTSGINANLITGQNKIRLTASGVSGINLDHLRYEVLQDGTYQAEYATLSGATVSSNYQGYVAEGYGNYNNNLGSIEWTINKEIASSINLKFRYANGFSTNRPLKLTVNGVVVTSSLAFNPTNSGPNSEPWLNWTLTSGLTVNLRQGENKVRLTETGVEGPNVDYLTFTSNPSPSSTTATTSLQSSSSTSTSANGS